MTGRIDQIIERLDQIIDEARANNDRAGYFAAMYREVTKEIKQAIVDDKFINGPLMTEFDVVFVQRYIDAFDQQHAGGPETESWAVSFAGAAKRRPIVVQQLLTAINAHINLDLGIAAATIAPGGELAGLQPDFNTINEILAGMTQRFMTDVEAVSPWIRFLDRIGGRGERHIIKFSIDVARDEAWKLAETLARLPQDEWPVEIARRDDFTGGLGRLILRPGWLVSLGLLVIRSRESNDVDKIIDVFASR